MIKSIDMIYFSGKPTFLTAVATKPHYRIRIFTDTKKTSVVIKSEVATNSGLSVINASERIATDLIHTFMLYDLDKRTPDDVIWIDQHNWENEPHGILRQVTYKWEYKDSLLEIEAKGVPINVDEYRITFRAVATDPKWSGISIAEVESIIGHKLETIY